MFMNNRIKQRWMPVSILLAGVLLLISGHGYALNDPMRPPFFDGSGNSETREVSRPLQLSMILMAAERRVAVLNGKTVQVGEDVDGYRVLRIERHKVVVSHKGKLKEVFLGSPQEQKTSVSNHNKVVED